AAAGRTAQAIRNAHLYEEVRRLLHEREETQAQLVHSEKMAALGRLTASVSHEINNPVQAVLGCLGLAVEELDEGADEETVDRYLAIAMQELRRIAAIVRRMREFYRPAEHEWDVVDVNDTLEAVVELTRNDLMGRDVQLELDLGQVPAVPIRPDQIRQVFLNLILNASDAMPAGGTLTLRTRLDETRLSRRVVDPAVRVEFEDTGTGIAPDVRARLFEPFFTTKREGSGLGLYISHGIVEAHEGEIEVESREGEGTIVRIWLPLSQDIETG
ncbi:MAG TPA: ATP-binding protein, partial [Anaerolineae bacterium]|nr:ATP-binding protein [Anaerolineae bacterium]